MYICVYVYVYMYEYAGTHICKSIHRDLHISVCIYIQKYIYTCLCLVHVYVLRMYIYKYILHFVSQNVLRIAFRLSP
jgi:hypothetical protein